MDTVIERVMKRVINGDYSFTEDERKLIESEKNEFYLLINKADILLRELGDKNEF